MADGRGREPRTEAEWQRAADAASALLVIEALGLPGTGAAEIDRGACQEVLRRARERGVVPHASALGATRPSARRSGRTSIRSETSRGFPRAAENPRLRDVADVALRS